ncbi:MAG: sulfite dehydrogenase [Gammaproteobacteria bacterium]
MNERNHGKLPQLQYAAGNGLLDRRAFLLSGISILSATALESSEAATPATRDQPQWMQVPGAPFSAYGQPSAHEDQVARFAAPNRLMRNSGASWTPLHLLQGTITPNGLHYERHHNGVPDIDPAKHELLLHGLVKSPTFFSIKDLLAYPMQSRICFIECGGNSNAGWNVSPSRAEAGYFHGLVSCSEWTGVPLKIILDEVGVDPQAEWLIADGADAFAMNISVPMQKARDDAMLALYQNGERLRPENGYPLRLVLPGWEGVLNVKWLRALKASAKPIMARNETARYTDLLPSGKARMFSFVMQAKSLLTSPSAGMRLAYGPGIYELSGLAWSGSGKIKRVDVSVDGGKSWAEAELQQPVLPKAFTRFRIPWRWNGAAAVIKSRALDEGGYTQPERQQLIAEQGRHAFYHYNAIVSWAVDANGSISHVYDDAATGDNFGLDSDWD